MAQNPMVIITLLLAGGPKLRTELLLREAAKKTRFFFGISFPNVGGGGG